MQQEVVEAQGHLVDSHVMEQIFDTVVEFGGRFEVEQFRIGRTNSDGSYLRLKIDAEDSESMEKMLSQLLGLGCSMVDSGDVELFTVQQNCCAPEDFYSPPIIEPPSASPVNGWRCRISAWTPSLWCPMIRLIAAVCAI